MSLVATFEKQSPKTKRDVSLNPKKRLLSLIQSYPFAYSIIFFRLFKHLNTLIQTSEIASRTIFFPGRAGCFVELTFLAGDEDAALGWSLIYLLAIEIIDNLFLILFMKGRRDDESCAGNNVEADEFLGKNSYRSVPFCYKICSFFLFPNLR